MGSELAQLDVLQTALAEAEDIQEVATIRAKTEVIAKVLAPRSVGDRYEGAAAYTDASLAHGEWWRKTENKRGVGQPQKNPLLIKNTVDITMAGFKSHLDAKQCAAIADPDFAQDYEIYKEEKRDNGQYPTLGGAYAWWKELNEEINGPAWFKMFNVWNFAKMDDRFGNVHPGNVPPQIMMNLNYYYTEPGDLVVDLFAGGGSSIDVCLADDPDYGGRRCKAYDIAPVRNDIIRHDVTAGLPEFDAKLVFLDPPYWKQKQGTYSEHETNLANMELGEFHDALENVIVAAQNQSEYVALIIGGTQDGLKIVDHSAYMMQRIGPPIQRVIVPYTTQQYDGARVARAKETGQMLNLHRDLIIWQR